MRIVVSPHLDDAVFSCWVALRAVSGTTVVTCFAGDPADGRPGDWDRQLRPELSGTEVMSLRKAEDAAALARIGAVPVHLALPEAQYRPADATAPLSALVEALGPVLAGADDVWVPAGMGGHCDHVAARDAALAAVRPGAAVTLYADQPYAAWYGWPFWVTHRPRTLVRGALPTPLGGRRPGRRWRADGGARLARAYGRGGQVRRLTADESGAKAVAVQDYATQAPALGYGADPARPARHMLAYEVWWPMRTPALAGGV